MPEKSPSIMCEICQGWHPTEAHAQYEQKARERRMAEIKARPDSAYRFDTLGFKSEKKEEIEPWMEEVIEKAKDLGDDLQGSGFYIHVGPFEKVETDLGKYPSVLSMITQESFQENTTMLRNGYKRDDSNPFVSEHLPGDGKIFSYAGGRKQEVENILVLQERWVQSREDDDLKNYQWAIQEFLTKRIAQKTIWREQQGEKWVKNQEELIKNLDTVDGRKKAMKYILVGEGSAPRAHEKELIGVIFKVGDSLRSDPNFRIEERERTYDPRGYNLPEYFTGCYYKDERVIRIMIRQNLRDQQIEAENKTSQGNARAFYRKFIHALFVPHGSIEEQRAVLEKMLEMTKDHPERRLPIYNFYGKLVWPRPSENKQAQE